ncbi:MAG: hypothetical protein BJ554DRAFT_6361 [Olpidium bornovanus]|uniref:Uncharacterized protein n=1 Tax=Olpidium bornovanus TaxID=278681 RepID=A0A8H7ZYQ1_9FUNG|nr:MAG: hypothetical protein BJ554DRAFT_6361 [Olpidium bornovanus]
MKQQAARTPKGLQDLTDAAQANALEMLMGPALESKFVQTAYKKSRNPIDKSVFLGMLAGFWVGLGGLAGLSAAGGISEAVRHTHPILPKMAVGFFFPFARKYLISRSCGYAAVLIWPFAADAPNLRPRAGVRPPPSL